MHVADHSVVLDWLIIHRSSWLGRGSPVARRGQFAGRAQRSATVQRVAKYVRFSNRPFGVKRFQTIHHYSVDVAHGLVLLYGIGTKALPSWDFEDEVEQSV